MKAQVAVEYLVIAVIVIGTSVALFYYTIVYSSESIAISQTQDSVKTLANTINYVYALGPDSKSTVEIQLPPNLIDSYINRNEIGFKIGVGGRAIDIYEITKSSVSGSLPVKPGRHILTVNSTGSGVFIGTP